MSAGGGLKYFFFCDLYVLANNSAGLFNHPTQVSTQNKLAAICDYLRVQISNKILPSADRFKFVFLLNN